MIKVKLHKKIYLQCKDEEGELFDPASEEITWCEDKINENDVCYVLERIFNEVLVENNRLRRSNNELKIQRE